MARTAWNKGKPWSEWMSKDGAAVSISNLKPNPAFVKGQVKDEEEKKAYKPKKKYEKGEFSWRRKGSTTRSE